jgi:hypothetical protein
VRFYAVSVKSNLVTGAQVMGSEGASCVISGDF